MTMHMPFPGFPTLLPLVVIFTTFAFVLSVILIGKSPKAGACLVGGLIVAALILLVRAARGGVFSTPAGLPFAIIPGTFLFVLVVIVLAKAPKAGVVLVIGLLVLAAFGVPFFARVSHQPNAVAWQSTPVPLPPGYSQPVPSRHLSPPSATPAPIWSPGVDKELDADVYPSQSDAVCSLGRRIAKQLRLLVPEANLPKTIGVFPAMPDALLGLTVKDVLKENMPETTFSVVVGGSPDHTGVAVGIQSGTVSREEAVRRGQVEAILFVAGKEETRLRTEYIPKAWVENFASFASTRHNEAFIVARSRGTCTSESEARLQALQDASQQVGNIALNHASRRSGLPARDAAPISLSDLQDGGLIVDTFVQGFEGSAGKIWREALLLDVSAPKLAQLVHQKDAASREMRMSWARMGLSAVGVILLIGVIYFFLNMATRGYYEWSLRIASVVLAVVAVISILMVVK